ncbi:MAG: 3'-kinase, partial [Candidatus Eremiobacteraeota bacterium]|nr:3'-kinase [Candidatus Eremiobacteraeota bacterium]
LLHGDLHHDNILHHPGRGWLAIDPKGVVGEPAFDLACALLNPVWLPDLVEDPGRLSAMAANFEKRLDLPAERIRQFAFVYACLSVCWSWEDGDDPEPRLRMVRRLSPK